MGEYHLAQINVGRLLAPIDDPLIAGFANALDEINALADTSRGFIWQLQTEDGDATAIRPYDDDSILINMSVWASIEALGDFVYRSDHTAYLRRRREWFERMRDTITALWWVPAGAIPTVDEGVARLDHLREHGPTPRAFTFRHRFSPDESVEQADDRDECPA